MSKGRRGILIGTLIGRGHKRGGNLLRARGESVNRCRTNGYCDIKRLVGEQESCEQSWRRTAIVRRSGIESAVKQAAFLLVGVTVVVTLSRRPLLLAVAVVVCSPRSPPVLAARSKTPWRGGVGGERVATKTRVLKNNGIRGDTVRVRGVVLTSTVLFVLVTRETRPEQRGQIHSGKYSGPTPQRIIEGTTDHREGPDDRTGRPATTRTPPPRCFGVCFEQAQSRRSDRGL